MRRIDNTLEMIAPAGEIKNKTIIDVGCGTGDFVRELTRAGAQVIGIDTIHMLAKAKENPPAGNEGYVSGVGENFPFKNNRADMIIFFASLHHVPEALMIQALKETHRVLKSSGIGLFLEPIGREGSYFEILRLAEDEREVQRLAYEAIQNAQTFGLVIKSEEILYFERSFDDYVNLLNVFVEDEKERNGYIEEARKITRKMCREANVSFADYRFKSIARLNILQKV